MKKILLTLMMVLFTIGFTSCELDSKDDKETDTPVATDNDGTVYENFSYNIGLYQVGYKEQLTTDDIALTYESSEENGTGSAKIQIAWENATTTGAKAYISQYSDGGENAPIIDATGKTMIAKVKLPTGYLDGDGADTFPGVKLYIKGSDWSESSKWFGAWNIKDALDGNDQSDSGIEVDTEEGFVLLKATIAEDGDITANDNTAIYESGIVFEQNADASLTDDMCFYIDYIDFK